MKRPVGSSPGEYPSMKLSPSQMQVFCPGMLHFAGWPVPPPGLCGHSALPSVEQTREPGFLMCTSGTW